MTWTQISDYCIKTERHSIAKLLVHGEPGYVLWLDGVLVHRCFKSSRLAREYAAEHEKPAVTPTV